MAYESLYTGEQIDEAIGKVISGEVSPQGGVKSFKGRTGHVTPQSGDYTPEQIGALSASGGALSGDLQMQIPEGQTAKISFGDSEKAYVSVNENGVMRIHGDRINITTKYMSNVDFTVNGERLDLHTYAKKRNPKFEGSISMDRPQDTDVGELSVALGYSVQATGNYASAFGYSTEASGQASYAGGANTTASGNESHAEGYETSATGDYSHAEGTFTTADGICSHAEGSSCNASGEYSHAEGGNCIASGKCSHAEGWVTEAYGEGSHAGGLGTIAAATAQMAVGQYNVELPFEEYKFMVGKGSTFNLRANCFRVADTGVYASGNYNSSGADYAEMFEWDDGNPNAEERIGRFVTLCGEKITLAQPKTDFVLGIVSGNPSVVGDVHDDQWKGMYQYDIFGRPLYENVEVPEMTDRKRNAIREAHTEHRQRINPNYDTTQIYLPRSQRPEWDAVGMLGKLVAVDDGTCIVDGWCKAGADGVATYSNSRTKYRVMARIDETHIKVLML